jgi:Ca-activated chloride channel family protein
MFHFANPLFLLLLLAVPLLVWAWLRQRRDALRHPAAGLLLRLPTGRGWVARWAGAGLRGAGLAALACALAGPRWPDLRTRIDTEGIALMMVVDVSGSMAEPDFDWQGKPLSRLDAVKRVFRLFVEGGSGPDATPDGGDGTVFEGRPTDLIGLVTFAHRPETTCPLTLSHSVVLRLLDGETPRRIPGESETNLSDAIALGVHRLKSAGPRRKVLVLLTDGEHNVATPESGWTPRQAAQIAASLGIPVYTIDAGNGLSSATEPDSAPSPEGTASPGMIRAQAVRTLEDVARISGGRSFQARDTRNLLQTVRAIDALERSRIESFQYRRYHEGYPWFGLAALVLFAGAVALERTIWRRVP